MAENYLRSEKVSENKKSFFRRIIAPVFTWTVFLTIGGGAVYFFIEKGNVDNLTNNSRQSEKVKELTYFELKPPIIANFSDSSKAELIQVSITFLTENIDTINALARHQPKIRNNLITLISTQNPVELRNPEGKDKLRAEILKEVQKILKEVSDQNGIKEVLFTSFVMQ